MSTPAPNRRLAGKTALVTGSTRGLGRTIAEWLAREGANIVVSGREEADVQASVDAMKQLGVESVGIPADLSRVADAHRLAEEALAQVEQIDLLINNAGMSTRGNFWEVTDEDWDYQVNVNLRAPFILAGRMSAQMIEKGIRGRIVNVSTVGVRSTFLDAAVYCMAKGAVETVTQNMALELGPHGISVNCIAPGAMNERPGVSPPPDGWPDLTATIPLRRVGTGEDIAAAALFFCLPESEYVTGRTLLVDGGYNFYRRMY